MQRLARKPGVWGTIMGIAVLVLLSVLGIIPLDVARGITAGVSMLVAIGLVVARPLVKARRRSGSSRSRGCPRIGRELGQA